MPQLTDVQKAHEYLESIDISSAVVPSGIEDENGNIIDELSVTVWTRDLEDVVYFTVAKHDVEWYAECYDKKFNPKPQNS